MVAVTIFSVGILVFFVYTTNYSGEARANFEDLSYEGDLVMNNILSEGAPENWHLAGPTITLGLSTNGKLDDEKLDELDNLITNGDYGKTKILLNTKFDYYFFLDQNLNLHMNGVTKEGLGKPGTNKDNILATNLIKITRFTVYKDKPVTAYLYIWE